MAPKQPRLVGSFIREKRELMGLSQRALGLLFEPAVTTQFISNVERGVTPLPPTHVATLSKALKINEGDLLSVLEREYAAKLSGRLGKEAGPADPNSHVSMTVDPPNYEFFKNLYDAYRRADDQTRQGFHTVCESILKVRR